MNYIQAIKYLDSFQNLEHKTSYDYHKVCNPKRFSKLCDIIGRPQDDFKSILVSGTNGKGSVCTLLHSVLVEAGYKTGLYTSPHLLDLRERIKIDNKNIDKDEFSELIETVKKSIECAMGEDARLYKDITFFEIVTAASFLYFAKKKIDIAIIEIGLGGRFDATNILYPLVSVITSISRDHTHLLGSSLSKIANEKADIIKENSFAVSAPQKKSVMRVIKAVAQARVSSLSVVGADVKYKPCCMNFNETTFDCRGLYKNYKNIKLPLVGKHQAENATVSLVTLEILKKHFYFRIKEANIRKGFKSAKWPGRFDVIGKKPRIIIDGAHNRDSAKALKHTIEELIGKKGVDALILGFSSDKDIKAIGSLLCPLGENIIFTRSHSSRAVSPVLLAKMLSKECKNSLISEIPKAALAAAKKLTSKNGTILIAGSLFLVADAMGILCKD